MNLIGRRETAAELANEANLILALFGEPNELARKALIESLKRVYRLGRNVAYVEIFGED